MESPWSQESMFELFLVAELVGVLFGMGWDVLVLEAFLCLGFLMHDVL